MLLRTMLIVILTVVTVYTIPVLMNEGLTLFAVFFGDIMQGGWPGQFNLDFLCMLILSATWTAWRNEFSGAGMGLAVLALFFGAPFLCIYLLVLSFQTGGDVKTMLVGEGRV